MKNLPRYLDFAPSWQWLMQSPVCFTAFGFGTGLSPLMPGTVGTLPALPLAAVWFAAGGSAPVLAVLCIPLFFIGIFLCGYTEKQLAIPDYGGIVFDEIVAMLLVLCTVPQTWRWWLAAFVAFRVFDMLKPFPIRWFDKHLHGGFGIMFDDILAAGMAALLLWLLRQAVLFQAA